MNRGSATVAVMVVLGLSGCASPEGECRSGVEQMKGRLVGIIGSGQHKDASDPIVQAHTQLDIAQTQLATGAFEGCLESLREARALLNRGTRN